tara:strand:- start:609 stop:764 length:156 start_codon:yes stop_codon:yes gene_type:complete
MSTEKKCNECQNESENETLYWDNELDKPNMVDYTCLCQSCYNKKESEIKCQ